MIHDRHRTTGPFSSPDLAEVEAAAEELDQNDISWVDEDDATRPWGGRGRDIGNGVVRRRPRNRGRGGERGGRPRGTVRTGRRVARNATHSLDRSGEQRGGFRLECGRTRGETGSVVAGPILVGAVVEPGRHECGRRPVERRSSGLRTRRRRDVDGVGLQPRPGRERTIPGP